MSSNDIQELFRQISEMGIWEDDMPMTPEEYSALLDNDADALEEMLLQDTNVAVENYTLNDLMRQAFPKALKTIQQFTLAKRITILSELDTYRSYLYSQASKYGAEGIPREDVVSPKDWQMMMGKIKHLEIIQAWLYGIL